MKKLLIVVSICIALCLCAIPTSARTVENGGTITIGEEHLHMEFSDGDAPKTFAHWSSGQINMVPPSKIINLENTYTDASFPESEFSGNAGVWYSYDPINCTLINWQDVPLSFELVAPVVTSTPTPTPIPAYGNIVISSSPSDATVYVDNAIKGITPLNVTVSNGGHVVKIKKIGYLDYERNVVVDGEDVKVYADLIPVATVATTIPTTIVPTTNPTTIVTTDVINVTPTASPTGTVTVEETETDVLSQMSMVEQSQTSDTDAKLESMQAQINAQGAMIEEQNITIQKQGYKIDFMASMLDYILRILGMK